MACERGHCSSSTSASAGSVDLGDEHVEVAGQPGGQVGDVAAGTPRPRPVTRRTMPGRSPPCTLSTYGAPGGRRHRLAVGHLAHGRRSASRRRSARPSVSSTVGAPTSPCARPASSRSGRAAASSSSPRGCSPRSASAAVVSAMMPGRSWPRTVIARMSRPHSGSPRPTPSRSSPTGYRTSGQAAAGSIPARSRRSEHVVQHRRSVSRPVKVFCWRRVVAAEQRRRAAVRRGQRHLDAVRRTSAAAAARRTRHRRAAREARRPSRYAPSATTTRRVGATQPRLARRARARRCRARPRSACCPAARSAPPRRSGRRPAAARRRRAALRRLRGQPDPVQRREEPVARAVAGEDPAGPVAAVRGRRQPDDPASRAGVGRSPQPAIGPAPVRLVGERTRACRARRPRATSTSRGQARQTVTRASSVGDGRRPIGQPDDVTRAAVRDRSASASRRVVRPAGAGRHGRGERLPGHRVRVALGVTRPSWPLSAARPVRDVETGWQRRPAWLAEARRRVRRRTRRCRRGCRAR